MQWYMKHTDYLFRCILTGLQREEHMRGGKWFERQVTALLPPPPLLTCSLIFIHLPYAYSDICLPASLPSFHIFFFPSAPPFLLSVFPHPYPPPSHPLSFRNIYFVPPASAPCFTPGVDYFACICFSLLSSSPPLFFISCS